MNPADMLRIVDSLHREKNIEKEIVFQAIEAALITAAK
jgi:N utilization substance protein A